MYGYSGKILHIDLKTKELGRVKTRRVVQALDWRCLDGFPIVMGKYRAWMRPPLR